VAPPDHHLVLENGKIRINHGPRQNGFRPSIDVLFRTAARSYGPRTLGILLSGMLDDGIYGLQLIKQHGGMAIVQEPEEAPYDELPLAALKTGAVDQALPVDQITALIVENGRYPQNKLEGTPMTEQDPETEKIEKEIEQFEGNGKDHISPSILTCPDCGGVLWEIKEGGQVRYRCHVGHIYSMNSMLEEQARAIESALWSATRALRERAFLMRRLASLADKTGSEKLKKRYTDQAEEMEQDSNLLRRTFLDGRGGGTGPDTQVSPPPGE
jgi:two-component system chemotaxis response regulator CheB